MSGLTAKRILYIATAGLAVFFLTEASSRIWLPVKARLYGQYLKDAVRKPYPYVMFKGEPSAVYAPGETLNALGYRGAAPVVPKPPGEYRIFVVGGSTVFFGEPPISDLLEQQFHQTGHPHVRCYNFGVVSSVSTQDLVRTLLELVDRDPDLIVMYNGGNDIFSPLFIDPRPGYPYNFIVYENNPLLKADLKEYPLVALTAFGSNLMRILNPGYFLDRFVPMEETRKKTGFLNDDWKSEIIRIYYANMVKAARLAASHGTQLFVFFQPSAYYKKTYTAEERANLHIDRQPEPYQFADEFADEMRERTRAVFQNAPPNLQFIDLSDTFLDDTESVFKDSLHIYQEKQPDVAEAIYHSLKDSVTP